MPHDSRFRVVYIAPAVETRTAMQTFFNFLQLNEKVKKEFESFIEKTGGKPASWYSIRRAAQNIKATVLFFQDRDDEMTPLKDVKPLMDEAPANFRFEITEGLGHRRIYRDNKVSKAIIEFL
jgi:hypothetical protein